MNKEYALIIRTDSYAGNFEREMCAYVTGHIGECGTGKEYVDLEIKSRWADLVTEKSDDSGCYRPVSLGGCESTPGYSSNDVVIWLGDEPLDWLLKEAVERANGFNAFDKKINEYHKKVEVIGVEFIEIEKSITVKSYPILLW